MQALLKSRISQERNEIKRLMEMLTERGSEKKKLKERVYSPNDAEMTAMIQLVKENQLLEVRAFFFYITIFPSRLRVHALFSYRRK